jgi:hypothetical protein
VQQDYRLTCTRHFMPNLLAPDLDIRQRPTPLACVDVIIIAVAGRDTPARLAVGRRSNGQWRAGCGPAEMHLTEVFRKRCVGQLGVAGSKGQEPCSSLHHSTGDSAVGHR